MTNEQLIDEAIAILQISNMEDCAAAVQTLQSELERVKQIARDRLDTIQKLQSELYHAKTHIRDQSKIVEQLELELEELEDRGGLWGAHCRGEI